ncbi:TonB-dependent receptor [Sphingobacterium sp. HJSM2_6]|uniref:TonB-dependent receptor n=1 Tax=Sphingobacterium sp. HJSM2_6 TaxID=3366264 RepID=UPI003BBDA021
MLNKFILVCLTCFTVFSAYAQHELQIQITNKGKVPLQGASVKLNHLSMTSNRQGQVQFSKLSDRSYSLNISFVGYRDTSLQINPAKQSLISIPLQEKLYQTEEIYVTATRAKHNSATTYKNLSKEEISKKNLGQDIPYLLDQTAGVVIGSDAGAGIGYTNMTIRGSDNERINVTLNGIPLNNPESMGSFFVNLPDFASSTQSIQIQRGIGTSTNGAGAFGASLNIQTDALEPNAYVEFNNSYGSFNSWKNTLKVGSGLIKNKYAFNARLSNITSDGFIDRASSNLKSFYVDGGIYGKKHQLKATVFSGKEKTYQAWYGLPSPLFEGNLQNIDDYASAMELYTPEEIERLKNGGLRYNIYTYDNQTDNYTQTHSHLNYTFKPSINTSINAALHYTRGAGYYEEFRLSDELADYGIVLTESGNPIENSDLVRQRWLDNHFYGLTYALQHQFSPILQFTLGGAYNQYLGDHYGKVISVKASDAPNYNHRYYFNDAQKNDFNIFAKADLNLDKWLINLDLQYRNIDYHSEGDDDKIKNFHFKDQHNFFNPKIGATYFINSNSNIYASYAFASKEPNRKDYVENPVNIFPKPEKMQNIEAGYRINQASFTLGANVYAMLYQDQLIPTGKLNDVGEALRMNVENSHRIGIEADASWAISRLFTWSATAALSQNKIKNFTESVNIYNDNWDKVGEQAYFYKSTDIAKSPSAILSNNLTYNPSAAIAISFLSKYVSKMYLDNSSAEERSLKSSLVHHAQATYRFKAFGLNSIALNLLVNNLFNATYATNGYTWGQIFESKGSRDYYNFYYPQAGTNFLLGLNIRF